MREDSACFEALSSALERKLVPSAKRVFHKGQAILRQGDAPAGILLLHSGLARVSTATAHGHEILFGFVGPGEIIGEIEYFARKPVGCTVEATETTEASHITSAALDRLLEQEPALCRGLATILAQRYYRDFRRSSDRITYPIAYNVLRICLALLTGPEKRLPKRDLAEYLGTSERHLNRVLKELSAQGAVETGPGEVRRMNTAIAQRLMAATR
jgi:CRP-like cAMP-binding protein